MELIYKSKRKGKLKMTVFYIIDYIVYCLAAGAIVGYLAKKLTIAILGKYSSVLFWGLFIVIWLFVPGTWLY